MVVHAVWVIDASGIPLFYKAYSPLDFDPTLFSSFFSAIVHFQSEMMGRQLQDIAFEDLSFSYIVDAGLVFLACVQKDSATGNLLRSLRDVFNKYFAGEMILLSTPLRTSPEAQGLLRQFALEVDKLVGYSPKKEPVPVRVTALPRLLEKDSQIHKDLEGKFGGDGITVILLSDGKHNLNDIATAVKLPVAQIEEIVRYGERRGYVKVVSAYELGTPNSAPTLTED
jgi:hypothetical protein